MKTKKYIFILICISIIFSSTCGIPPFNPPAELIISKVSPNPAVLSSKEYVTFYFKELNKVPVTLKSYTINYSVENYDFSYKLNNNIHCFIDANTENSTTVLVSDTFVVSQASNPSVKNYSTILYVITFTGEDINNNSITTSASLSLSR